MDALTKEKKADIYVYKKRVVKKYVKQETDFINNVVCIFVSKVLINFGYRTNPKINYQSCQCFGTIYGEVEKVLFLVCKVLSSGANQMYVSNQMNDLQKIR